MGSDAHRVKYVYGNAVILVTPATQNLEVYLPVTEQTDKYCLIRSKPSIAFLPSGLLVHLPNHLPNLSCI